MSINSCGSCDLSGLNNLGKSGQNARFIGVEQTGKGGKQWTPQWVEQAGKGGKRKVGRLASVIPSAPPLRFTCTS